jgi:hypothetical protein
LQHEKVGRRNHYELIGDARLRHPIEAHVAVADLLSILRPRVG